MSCTLLPGSVHYQVTMKPVMIYNQKNNDSKLIFALMKKAYIQLHIAVFLAGFTAIIGKIIHLNEGVLVLYRLFFTVITLGVILVYKKEFIKLKTREALKIFMVGGLVAMHWVFFYGSVKYSNVSVSLTCLSAIGFFTALFEPLILGKKIKIIELGLGLFAIIGIYMIFDFHPQFKLGITFGIISALLASIFPVFNKKLLVEHSPKTVTLYEMCGGFLVLSIIIPFYLVWFPAQYYLPTMNDLFWLLILSWICTVLSFILQLNALTKISAFTANLTYNLEPVYGIILGLLIFNESKELKPGFYGGLSLIILAVILQMIRVRSSVKKNKMIFQEKITPGK